MVGAFKRGGARRVAWGHWAIAVADACVRASMGLLLGGTGGGVRVCVMLLGAPGAERWARSQHAAAVVTMTTERGSDELRLWLAMGRKRANGDEEEERMLIKEAQGGPLMA